MMNWPDNKRIAVMMAFDLDAETMWTTHGDGSTAHMTNLSRGAYGPKQGVPRILDMLDSHQVKATFFGGREGDCTQRTRHRLSWLSA